MNAGLALQWGVVGLAVAASTAYVVRRQAPGVALALRRRLALALLRPTRGPRLRALGRRIAPAPTVRLPQASGCSGCGERKPCGSASDAPTPS